jgi:hypothetical protein
MKKERGRPRRKEITTRRMRRKKKNKRKEEEEDEEKDYADRLEEGCVDRSKDSLSTLPRVVDKTYAVRFLRLERKEGGDEEEEEDEEGFSEERKGKFVWSTSM